MYLDEVPGDLVFGVHNYISRRPFAVVTFLEELNHAQAARVAHG